MVFIDLLIWAAILWAWGRTFDSDGGNEKSQTSVRPDIGGAELDVSGQELRRARNVMLGESLAFRLQRGQQCILYPVLGTLSESLC